MKYHNEDKIRKAVYESVKKYLLKKKPGTKDADRLASIYASYIMTLGEKKLDKSGRENLIAATKREFTLCGFNMDDELLSIAEAAIKKNLITY